MTTITTYPEETAADALRYMLYKRDDALRTLREVVRVLEGQMDGSADEYERALRVLGINL